MFRATVKPEFVADMEAAGKGLFAAIEAAQPEGVRYSWSKLADGVSFVLVVDLEDDAVNPLAGIAEFGAVMAELKGKWIAEPLVMEQLTPVGSYRLF
jgi:hypothetical protein